MKLKIKGKIYMLMSLIYACLVFVVLWFIRKFLNKFKLCKIGSMALFTGGVKTGKSTLSVHTAIKEYKSRVRKVKFVNFFRKLFKKDLIELPLLYSNVPLALPYVPLTYELLTRSKRFVYNSVIYVQEASLVADSQLLKFRDLNEQLLLYNKLIGHETKGGVLIYDTQCISDLHYSIKRCLSNYFYIHHLVKLPFFLILYVEENRYSDDGSIIVSQNEDTENKLKKVIISKRVWKYFDCYCYSSLTDNLPVEKTVVDSNFKSDLKARRILSFRNLKKEDNNEKVNN